MSRTEAFQIRVTHVFARREEPATTTVQGVALQTGEIEARVDGTVAATIAATKGAPFSLEISRLLAGSRPTLKLGSHETVFDVPAVPFDVDKFVASSTGAPFDRFGFGGRLDFTGPFLGFNAPGVTCAFAQVFVHNRTSDEKYWVEATVDGDVALELSDTFPGDTLDVWAEDTDRTRSPHGVQGYVVPSEGRVNNEVETAVAGGDAAEILRKIREFPTAGHREVLRSLARDATDEAKRGLFLSMEEELFANANQIEVHSSSRP